MIKIGNAKTFAIDVKSPSHDLLLFPDEDKLPALGYTMQRNNTYIKLLDYHSRWYDPELGRFLQPDSIIPSAANPQNLNRFSYVGNSPINNSDPSGHEPHYAADGGVFEFFVVAVIILAVVIAIDNSRRHESSGNCSGSLSECFQNNELKQFSDHQQIDSAEFHDLLDSVSNDLKGKFRTGFDPSRSRYDTPFYTGNSDAPGVPPKYKDVTVCIDNKCSPQSSVNYFAEGMYSADTGESLQDGKGWVSLWKNIVHHHDPSDDDNYWFEYGYNYFKSKQKEAHSQPIKKIQVGNAALAN